MRHWSREAIIAAMVGACASFPSLPRAMAHGYVGDFLFPATVTTDDPLVTDELVLPALSLNYSPGDHGGDTRVLGAGFEFDKVILPQLAFGVADTYLWLQPHGRGEGGGGERAAQGWDNLTLSLKYEVWRSEEHRAIISLGLESDLGGTGGKSIGREPSTTFTPTLYFGKASADLPDTLAFFRPIAVTGTLGLSLPTATTDHAIEWGLALEYNIPYLQQHVKDLGLPEPFRNMIPLVEFSMESPLNRGAGTTTGSINPGVLWESKYFQVGIEAMIPVNRASGGSGNHVGAIVEFQIYIDDLLPQVFGHPVFGE